MTALFRFIFTKNFLIKSVNKNFVLSSQYKMFFGTIGTHDGTFHCDEVFGCFLLKQISKEAKIIRSRDENILKDCDIVIDVGGVYDHSKLRYDHHQKSFNHTLNSLRPEKHYSIKLSSAGLIFCHYGDNILKTILGDLDATILDSVYNKVYETFVQEIDAIDNGVSMCSGEPMYNIHSNLSSRVSKFNKAWNQDKFNEDEEFLKALDYVGHEFINTVNYIFRVWWPARSLVLNSIKSRFSVHGSGEIIRLVRCTPFIDHLFELEKEMEIESSLKYVIYPEESHWRIRAVPIAPSSFILRTPLLEAWRGLQQKELESCSVKGITFVHSSGFIGGNKTIEGAIDMCVKSISNKIKF